MRQFLAELRPDIIPPFGIGQRIGPRALLIGEDELDPARETLTRAIANEAIAFRLDFPGGLSETVNEDNWGAGPGGYDVARLRALGGTGDGIRIGIADSGLDAGHAAFAGLREDGRLIGFAGFAADGTKEVQHDGDGRLVADDAATPLFTHWHGTFCAALLVGGDTDGRLRGLAPRASIAVAKVLQNFNNGTVASIYAGLAWLAEKRCDIVSLSLGWEGLHDDWAVPILSLLERGTVVVAAAGNTFGVPGVPPNSSPANYPLADEEGPGGMLIAVGSIDPQGRVADTSGGPPAAWTNFGGGTTDTLPPPGENRRVTQVPRIVAPGVGIVSAAPGGGYRLESGTSMATPHVAGLIAVVLQLLRRQRRNATAIEAARLVLSCAGRDGLPADEPRYGHGRIDMARLETELRRVLS